MSGSFRRLRVTICSASHAPVDGGHLKRVLLESLEFFRVFRRPTGASPLIDRTRTDDGIVYVRDRHQIVHQCACGSPSSPWRATMAIAIVIHVARAELNVSLSAAVRSGSGRGEHLDESLVFLTDFAVANSVVGGPGASRRLAPKQPSSPQMRAGAWRSRKATANTSSTCCSTDTRRSALPERSRRKRTSSKARRSGGNPWTTQRWLLTGKANTPAKRKSRCSETLRC